MIPNYTIILSNRLGVMEKIYKLWHYILYINPFLIGFFLGFSNSSQAQNYTPGGISGIGLELWLDANQGIEIIDNRVSEWTDLSGAIGRSALQGIAARRPTQELNALNGQAWINFNNTVLQTGPLSSLDNQNEFTVFMVGKGNSFTGRETFFRFGYNNDAALWGLDYFLDGGNTLFEFSSKTSLGATVARREIHALNPGAISPQILSAYWRGDGADLNRSVDLYINGVMSSNPANIDNANFIPTNHSNVFIGASAQDLSGALNGNIAELIIFSSVLNEAQRIIIENYLEAKYGAGNGDGIQISEDKYAQPGANSYTQNLSGIGRTSSTDIQTQGCSGGLCISSNTNTGDFLSDENDFLLFAYESNSNSIVTDNLPSNAQDRWERDWFLDKQVVVANGGALELRFDYDSVGLATLEDNAFVLLFRDNLSSPYQAIAYTETLENTNEVVFDVDANLIEDGYYTVGAYRSRPGAGNHLVFESSRVNGIRVQDSPALDLTGDLSIEAWVKFGNNPFNPSVIISKGAFSDFSGDDFSQKQYLLQINEDRTLSFIIGDGIAGTSLNMTSSATRRVSLDRLNHIAVTLSGTTATIYIDGIDVGSETVVGARVDNDDEIILGAQNDFFGDLITPIGSLDELRIWNVALDENTIRTWLCQRMNASHPNFANLVAYYDFDEFTEIEQTSAIDESNSQILDKVLDKKNNNTGTLVGFGYTEDSGWGASTAPLGDISTFVYMDDSLRMENPGLETDALIVDVSLGTPESIHIYYVGESPNFLSRPDTVLLDESRYWGVHLTGGDDYTYEAIYEFAGNTQLNTEGDLRLLFRNNNADTVWKEAADGINFSIDEVEKTMTLSGLTGTEIIAGEIDEPLPISLLSFEAALFEEKSARLTWQTASELNNLYFAIERSVDGQIYEEIGRVNGAGNSSQVLDYSWIDAQPKIGLNFYRLKQVDIDGTFSYSWVRAVSIGEGQVPEMLVYPNPIQTSLTLDFQREFNESALLQLYDLQGNLLSKERIQLDSSAWKMKLPSLASGVYILQVITSRKSQVFRLVKD